MGWPVAVVVVGTVLWPFAQAGAQNPGSSRDSLSKQALTLERIHGTPPLLAPLPSQIRWLGDGKGVTYLTEAEEGEVGQRVLVAREVPSGKERVICLTDTVAVPPDLRRGDDDRFAISGYEWDARGRRAVFAFRGDLFTVTAKDGRVERLTQTAGEERDAAFSPDGKGIAFTRANDLYVLDLDAGAELRLTTTGCDSILNGVLDWVYMEELFTRGDVKAFWWSPDSKRLAFLETSEHPVPEFPLIDWMPVHATSEMQRYPAAGDPSPLVRVGVANAHSGEVTWTDTDTSDDSYIARVYWLGDSRAVAIEKLNRAQDELVLYFADAATGSLEEVLRETHTTWVNASYLRHYYEKKRQFVWGSERDGHAHLYLYNLDGSLARQLTSGAWEVTTLAGVDESRDKIYLVANERDVRERHLYTISEKGEGLQRITREEGTHSVVMSPDNKYYVDTYSSHARPRRVVVCDVSGRELFVLGDQLGEELRAVGYPVPEFFTIESEGLTFHCMMTKPPDLDPDRKHPVIVYTYGGPNGQVVRKAWSSQQLWHAMMAQRGYIVFSLDNRGSSGRGRAWEDPVLRRLGHLELADQMAGVAYLKTLPYVDPDRIGIWGWSYGAYLTLMALFKASDTFAAGVAVAPVTDWRLYDSIYTERYMKLPGENEEGYREGAPVNFAEGLRGSLLLMHGGGDDNVHTQNSFRLVRELIDADKDFEFMIYPGRTHSIRGKADRRHLYSKMTRFFDRHLLHAQREAGVPARSSAH
jgi:dipeptidyl-peptidase-4